LAPHVQQCGDVARSDMAAHRDAAHAEGEVRRELGELRLRLLASGASVSWCVMVRRAGLESESAVMAAPLGDIDLTALGRALWRKKTLILGLTLVTAALAFAAVNFVTPRYKSEARVLIETRENIFLRRTQRRPWTAAPPSTRRR
jgi:hypothetical protein